MKNVTTLLDRATTAPQSSSSVASAENALTIQASIVGTGSLTASISIYGSNSPVNSNGVFLKTLSLSGTTLCDGFSSFPEWPYYFVVLNAVTGTNASVTVTAGV